MMENKTNQELTEIINECEKKYQKLLKVANKLAEEMDSLVSQYKEAANELNNRK